MFDLDSLEENAKQRVRTFVARETERHIQQFKNACAAARAAAKSRHFETVRDLLPNHSSRTMK